MDKALNHELCNCGHLQKDHEDMRVFDGWGLGKCTMGICQCKRFDCKTCFQINNPKEPT